jgi:protein ImuB
VPHLDLQPADPEGDGRALGRLADWATRWTPLVARDGADGLWLDVTGAAHLAGGEAALLADVGDRLARAGIAARVALAATPGAAHALARFGRDALPLVPAAAGQHGLMEALAPLPVAALRLAPAVVEGLNRLGVRTVAALARLPREGLERRFGVEPGRQLDRALGRRAEPITPLAPPVEWQVARAFAEPIGTSAAVEAALADLAADLAVRLVREGRGATRLALALYRSDGVVLRSALGTARPTRDAAHVARLFAARLAEAPDGVDVGLGLDLMSLAAVETAPFAPVQTRLDGEDPAGVAIAELIDRLTTRLGPGRVGRLVPVASHVPARAQRLGPAVDAALASAHAPRMVGTLAQPDGDPDWPEAAWPADRPRPLRLLSRPEPVEVMAALPDGPPALFRWRRAVHRVARAEGPERVAPEWWRAGAAAATRDYYRVEDEAGRRFWLYREGLYEGDGGAHAMGEGTPAWFLHGVFA